MGALPKRRISTGRAGRRQLQKGIKLSSSRLSRTTKKQRQEIKKDQKKS